MSLKKKPEIPRVLKLARLVTNYSLDQVWDNVDWEDRESLFERLKVEMSGCTKCILSQTRNHVVLPDGRFDAPIMVVCEGPGFLEDLTKTVLVGQQELRTSHCAKCKNVTTCYDSRISWGKKYTPLASKRSIECKPNYLSHSFLESSFGLYSAGSVIDGLLHKKYGLNFPRYNWSEDSKKTSPWLFTNAVQCRSWNQEKNQDTTPPKLAIKLCKDWLSLMYGIVQPKVLVLMGDVARISFFGDTKKLPIHQLIESKYGPVICTPHPARIMRMRDNVNRQALEYALLGKSLDTALFKAGLIDFNTT